MDFTIRLKPDGTAETAAAAQAVHDVRVELEATAKATKSPADLRALAGQAQAAKAELARLVAQKKDLETGGAVDVGAGRALESQIAAARTRVASTQAALVSGGGAGFDAKAHDAREAAARKAEGVEAARAQRAAAASAKAQAAQDTAQRRAEAAQQAAEAKRKASEERAAATAEKATQRAAAAKQKAEDRAEAQRIKADEKRAKDAKRERDREDKDIARAADRAQKALIRDAKDREKAQKKEQSDNEKAAKERAKFVDEKFKTPMMLGAAGVGASLVGLGYKFAPLALGYQGMARLSMISTQASFNLRRLFQGTNPRPLLDAIQRTQQELLDPRTVGGNALGGLLRRTADGIMSALAKAEPYVRVFFKGMILGGLQAEIAWLKFRIAIQPALNLLPRAGLDMLSLRAGVMAVHGAIALLGVGTVVSIFKAGSALLTFGRAALAATGPILPLVAAVGALVAAMDQASKLSKEWDSGTFWRQVKQDVGLISQEEREKQQGIVTGDEYDKRHGLGKYAPKAEPPKAAEKAAAPAGRAAGEQMAAGMVQGLKAGQARVEAAGGDLARAAEKGAKDAAEIRSPARRWRREIGGNMAAGAALGLADGAPALADAAAEAMPAVPAVATGGAAGLPGRSGTTVQVGQIGPFYGMPAGGEAQVRRWVRDALDDFAEQLGARLAPSPAGA